MVPAERGETFLITQEKRNIGPSAGFPQDCWPVSLWIWSLMTLLFVVSLSCRSPSAGQPRWNVVVVLVDTLRADRLSIYDYDRLTSPFLEEFSRKGVIFEQARSQAACTFPSVNSLMTSRYPQHFQHSAKTHGWAIPDYLPTLAEMLQAVGYRTAAVSSSGIVRVNPSPRNPDGGYGAGFGEFDDDCMRKPAKFVNEAAFRILEDLGEPFFLYLHYFDPHSPYQPPGTHPRVFAVDQNEKEWISRGELRSLSAMLYGDGASIEFTDQDLADILDLYDEEILYFDQRFAELIQRLEDDALLDRTLVVFVSDHGEEFLEHGHIYHCRDLTYDTVLRTPLIFWVPGLEEPKRSSALAQNLDVVPTILDFLGVDFKGLELDGESLRPAIDGGRSVHRYVFGVQRFARWVTDGRYKLSYNIKTGETQLFDLRLDPAEQTELAVRRPETTEELKKVLMSWIGEVEGRVDLATRVDMAAEVTERLRALGYLQ